MARDRANINTAIWTDQDWRDLPMAEQWLYKLLMTHPSLTYAGIVDWRPNRLAAMASDVTAEGIMAAGKSLQVKRFIVIDEGTEEVLVRSFLRHDGLLKQPRLGVSVANSFASVASKKLRQVIIHELQRLHQENPDWKAFGVSQVLELLKLEGRDMDAFGDGFTHSFTPGFTPNASQALALPTSTATSTATPTDVGGSGGKRKPERPLPAGWLPNESHKAYANENSISLDFQADRFRNHAQANDRRARDWDAAFRNWLLKAEKTTTTKNALWDS